MQKILVSACLLGEPVRFHGGDSRLADPTLQRWIEEGRVVRLCPEVAGGLPTPRPAAEIVRSPDGRRVLTASGRDVTAAFAAGADEAVRLCREHGIRIAILKESSPSCGGQRVYDGTFSGRRIEGQGITAGTLMEIGVRVFNETEIARAARALSELERSP
jgi:uncharacterized protein YbbK (DUF523 family)